jgi:hypothetical protein
MRGMKKLISGACLVLLVSCKTGGDFEPIEIDLSSRKTPAATPPPGATATPLPSSAAPAPAPLSSEASRPVPDGPDPKPRQTGPEEVVASRAAAFERGDIPALLALYAADAQTFDPPDRLRDSGLDQIRKSYARELVSSPEARATESQRISAGRYVVERQLGAVPGAPAIVIYEVRRGQITRTWILR